MQAEDSECEAQCTVEGFQFGVKDVGFRLQGLGFRKFST